MNTKQINFERNIIYENKKRFAFKFDGIALNSDINKEKINKLLDNFINTKLHTNMLRNVAFIRTILKNFEEKSLIVEYNDPTYKETIKYINGNLFLFTYKKQNEKSKNSITAEFTPKKGLNISFSDYDETSIIDYPHYKVINQQFSDLMKHINSLKTVKPINLDRDAKALIEIYKLFYNENPDFSLSNINIKVQTMMSILAQFGITIGDDYTFNLLGKIKMPISINLELLVNKLFPLGEITNIDNPIKLADEAKEIIKIVGEHVRKAINGEYHQDKTLITISKIIYAGRYSLSSNSNIKSLSEFTNCPPNEVEASIKLVKRIEANLNNNK